MLLTSFLLVIFISFTNGESKDRKSNAQSRKYHGITLYSESKYNFEYLREFKKMIGSLLGSSITGLINNEMIRGRSEESTASTLYGLHRNEIIECSSSLKTHLRTIKVLQDEESNYVMLREDTRSGKQYVEKSTRSQSSFDAEVEFFRRMDKNNKLFPTFTCFMRTAGREERHSVVTEFIRGRDSHILAGQATKDQLKSMVKQLFEAVVDLHRMGYIHADIKPGNVLVTDDYQVKLIDFGMATRVGHGKKYRGSPYTRAPELHDMCPGEVDLGIDWWAFGSTVAIWYYYYYTKSFLKNHQKIKDVTSYFEIYSSYDFTPFKYSGSGFRAGTFPSSFEPEVRKFLALFLTIDPELRSFDCERLQNLIRNHEYFSQ